MYTVQFLKTVDIEDQEFKHFPDALDFILKNRFSCTVKHLEKVIASWSDVDGLNMTYSVED